MAGALSLLLVHSQALWQGPASDTSNMTDAVSGVDVLVPP